MNDTPFDRRGMVYRPRFEGLLDDIVAVRKPPVVTDLDTLHARTNFQGLIKQPIPGILSVANESSLENRKDNDGKT